jgi:8-oxo-dGTP diphosphatase
VLLALTHRLHRLALTLYAGSPAPLRRLVIRVLSPPYILGVLCVLRHGDDVLLLRQRHDPTDWSLPGGLLKRGETPRAALAREVAEELGLELPLPDQPSLINVVPEVRRADLVFVLPVDARPKVRIDDVEVVAVDWLHLDDPVENEVTESVLRLVRQSSDP